MNTVVVLCIVDLLGNSTTPGNQIWSFCSTVPAEVSDHTAQTPLGGVAWVIIYYCGCSGGFNAFRKQASYLLPCTVL